MGALPLSSARTRTPGSFPSTKGGGICSAGGLDTWVLSQLWEGGSRGRRGVGGSGGPGSAPALGGERAGRVGGNPWPPAPSPPPAESTPWVPFPAGAPQPPPLCILCIKETEAPGPQPRYHCVIVPATGASGGSSPPAPRDPAPGERGAGGDTELGPPRPLAGEQPEPFYRRSAFYRVFI